MTVKIIRSNGSWKYFHNVKNIKKIPFWYCLTLTDGNEIEIEDTVTLMVTL